MTDYSRICKYFEQHRTNLSIDDITWNDLNMNEVYDSINYTVSSLGEEVLYNSLRNPMLNKEDIVAYEKRLSELLDEKLRNKLLVDLKKLSKVKKISIFQYLYMLDLIEEKSILSNVFPAILMIVSLVLGLCFGGSVVLLALLAFIFNTILYFRKTSLIKPYIICFSYIFNALKIGNNITLIDKQITSGLLKNFRGAFLLGRLSGNTVHGGTGNPFDLLIDLLKMSFHFDVIAFYYILSQIKKDRDGIEEYLYKLGQIDADIAVIEYRKKLEYFSNPVFIEETKLELKDIYHPLLKNPVSNSINTKDGIIITGSNASGKSTFLRTVGINIILAQSVNTVLASEYKAPVVCLFSSMDISDSISEGESFYMAEIRSIRRIIEAKANGYQIFCLIDELLKGTNTIERIASGSRILEYLYNEKIICFAATHDLELTELLKGLYMNYHFEEEVKQDDISFSYRILEGPSTTTNAIRLLKQMEFPDDVINGALLTAKNFRENGIWSL